MPNMKPYIPSDIAADTCFICGEPRAEGSEWCEDHNEPEGAPA